MNFLTRTGRRQSYTLYLHNNPFWTPCNVYKTRSDISQGKPQTIHGAGGCTLILQMPLPEDGGSWRASPALTSGPAASSDTWPEPLFSARGHTASQALGRACSKPAEDNCEGTLAPTAPSHPSCWAVSLPQGRCFCSQTIICFPEKFSLKPSSILRQ